MSAYDQMNGGGELINSENLNKPNLVVGVKFRAKIHVWGMLSHQALSQLRIVPQNIKCNGLP